jgi:hypothetical protein
MLATLDPAARAGAVLALQRTAGNAAVARVCNRTCRVDEARDANGCCIPQPSAADECRRTCHVDETRDANGCCVPQAPAAEECRRTCQVDETRDANGCCTPVTSRRRRRGR